MKYYKVNDWSVKFIENIDDLNNNKILVYSSTLKKYFNTNAGTYDLLKYVKSKEIVTYTELVSLLGSNDENISMLNYIIEIELLLEVK